MKSKKPTTDTIKPKERILIAAGRVFARCPVNMATLSMVSKESGMKHSLIMYHFKSKDNLYDAVLKRAGRMYLEALGPIFSAIENTDPLTKRRAGKFYAELIAKTFDGMYDESSNVFPFMRIMMFESCYPSPLFPEYYAKNHKNQYDLIVKMIQAVNDRYDDRTAVLKGSQIFGLICTCLAENEILKRKIGFDIKTETDRTAMKKMTVQNAFFILESGSLLEKLEMDGYAVS